jgi:hypothetical protein
MSTAASPTAASPTEGSPPAPDAVRASHAEREETVARLHQALGEGRLDLDETETRVAAAYAARYRDDLPPLLTDLPSEDEPHLGTDRAPAWSALWTSLVWRLRVVLFGPDATSPSALDLRWATVGVAVAFLWTVVCAVVAAALVAA